MRVGNVWLVKFPFEDNKNRHSYRPVVILDVEKLRVLSVKVTKHEERDEYDTPIIYWEHAKLKMKSTARVSKTIYLDKNDFEYKIGQLYKDDLKMIQTLYMEYVLNESK